MIFMFKFDNLNKTDNLAETKNLTKIDDLSKFDNLFRINNLTVIDNKKHTIYFHILEFSMLCGIKFKSIAIVRDSCETLDMPNVEDT